DGDGRVTGGQLDLGADRAGGVQRADVDRLQHRAAERHLLLAVLVDGELDLAGQRVVVRLGRAVGSQRLLDDLGRRERLGQIHLQRQQIRVNDEGRELETVR